ncbi:MAG: response regulator [Acidobacteriia bacterium]|nr:response regulator [Terriglobia bacterium]
MNSTVLKYPDLEKLVSVLNEVSRGNLDVAVQDAGDEELQPLVRALRGMVENLRREIRSNGSQGAAFRNFVESLPVPLVKWSPRGEAVIANQAAVALWGYSDREEFCRAAHIQDLFIRSEEVKRLMRGLAENGVVSDLEITIRRSNGEPRLVSISAATLRDESHAASGFAAMLFDISGQRQMEANLIQMEKLEAIGNFASGLAHDLNNILCSLLPNVEMLRRRFSEKVLPGTEFEKGMRQLESLEKSAQCAVTLAKELMSFSRKSQSNLAVFNLNTVVLESLHQLKQSLDAGIRVETDLAADLWNIEADQSQIEEILIHLGKNAQQAMKGNGSLRVSTSNLTRDAKSGTRSSGKPPGDYVLLTVRDTGGGIPEEYQHRIFDPFFSFDGAEQSRGLSLSMVYSMVQNNRGCIEVESAPNEGTAFKILLPRTTKESCRIPIEQTDRSDHRLSRILVVDDEDLVREATSSLLWELGYEVYGAHDGDEALLRVSQNEQFDLVLLDIQMPRMDGHETLARLRGVSPNLKVILTSGHCPPENVQEILQRYNCTFLQKPYRMADISQAVQKVLGEPASHN